MKAIKIDDGLKNTYWLETKYFNSYSNDSVIVKLKYIFNATNLPKTVKIGYTQLFSTHEYLITDEPRFNNLVLHVFGVLFFLFVVIIFGFAIFKRIRTTNNDIKI